MLGLNSHAIMIAGARYQLHHCLDLTTPSQIGLSSILISPARPFSNSIPLPHERDQSVAQ